MPSNPLMFDPNNPYSMAIAEKILAGGTDLSDEEEQIRRQRALADELRVAPNNRMDWASQASRAVQGITSGYNEKLARERAAALGNTRRNIFTDARNDVLRQRELQAQEARDAKVKPLGRPPQYGEDPNDPMIPGYA